jgi:hypothetical protein
MGNLRPFKLFGVTLLKLLKFGYFTEKSVKKVSILALDMTV